MTTPLPTLVCRLLALTFTVAALTTLTYAGDDWLPITPAELKMTTEPKAPGAPAIYLYRQVDRNDENGWERIYARIHDILTGKDQSKDFAQLSNDDRKAILEILRDTKTDLPDYWRK